MSSARARQGYLSTRNTMAPGTGITGATGELVKWSVQKDPVSGVHYTRGIVDITGIASVATENDIMAFGTTNPGYLGQITAAVNGTIFAGKMSLLEAPATGEVDIDLWSADEATGKGSDLITGLTNEVAVFTAAGDWGTVTQVLMTAPPVANQYLYLTTGTASTPTAGTYTAGIFLIEFWGQ
jgi:hypothetical protein